MPDSTNQEENQTEKNRILMRALSNTTQKDILVSLHVFGELSTAEISDRLGKTKPTILRHIKELVDNGLVHKRVDKNSPGNIKRHYYQLARDPKEVPDISTKPPEFKTEEEMQEYLDEWAILTKSMYQNYRRIIDLSLNYVSQIIESEFRHLPLEEFTYFNFYFTEEQYKQARKLFNKYIEDLIQIKQSAKRGEYRPHYFTAQIIPIGNVMQAK